MTINWTAGSLDGSNSALDRSIGDRRVVKARFTPWPVMSTGTCTSLAVEPWTPASRPSISRPFPSLTTAFVLSDRMSCMNTVCTLQFSQRMPHSFADISCVIPRPWCALWRIYSGFGFGKPQKLQLHEYMFCSGGPLYNT